LNEILLILIIDCLTIGMRTVLTTYISSRLNLMEVARGQASGLGDAT